MTAAVAPRFNAPLYNRLYNEVIGPTNDILRPSNGKIYEKRTSIGRNLYIANTFCQSLCPSVYRRQQKARRSCYVLFLRWIMLSIIPIMLRICSIFDLWNKSLNLSYESNFLLDWFSGSSDASLPLNTWRRIAPINLISSIKSIAII